MLVEAAKYQVKKELVKKVYIVTGVDVLVVEQYFSTITSTRVSLYMISRVDS